MKKVIISIVTVFSVLLSHAQIKYTSDNKLTFGDISLTNNNCVTGWEGWGHYFHNNNYYGGETWLKIVLGAQNARISGNGGYVVFYGDTFEDIYVKNVFTNSDARAKSNIMALGNAMHTVKKLKPKSYGWASAAANNKRKMSQRELGFLAQDLETLVPEAVATDAEGNKLVNYNTLIPLLTGAIQELEARVVALEAKIKQIESSKSK